MVFWYRATLGLMKNYNREDRTENCETGKENIKRCTCSCSGTLRVTVGRHPASSRFAGPHQAAGYAVICIQKDISSCSHTYSKFGMFLVDDLIYGGGEC